MNWFFKQSNLPFDNIDQQNNTNLGSPNVSIIPMEPLILEVVNEIKSQNPGFFNNVTNINVDTSGSQFGSVNNRSPNTININYSNIKNEVKRQLGGNLNENDPNYKIALKDAIKRTIFHENAHVNDYDPNNLTNPFPRRRKCCGKSRKRNLIFL